MAKTYPFRATDCWIWPKFGQKGQNFCFWPCGLFLLQSYGKHNKVSFDNLTSSAGSYLWPATHFKSVTISAGYPMYIPIYRALVNTFKKYWIPLLFFKKIVRYFALPLIASKKVLNTATTIHKNSALFRATANCLKKYWISLLA